MWKYCRGGLGIWRISFTDLKSKSNLTILSHSLGEQKSSCVKVIILHRNVWLTEQFYSTNFWNHKITPAAGVLGIEVNNTWWHHVFMGIKSRVVNFWSQFFESCWKPRKEIPGKEVVTFNMYKSIRTWKQSPSPHPPPPKKNQTNKQKTLYLSNSW